VVESCTRDLWTESYWTDTSSHSDFHVLEPIQVHNDYRTQCPRHYNCAQLYLQDMVCTEHYQYQHIVPPDKEYTWIQHTNININKCRWEWDVFACFIAVQPWVTGCSCSQIQKNLLPILCLFDSFQFLLNSLCFVHCVQVGGDRESTCPGIKAVLKYKDIC